MTLGSLALACAFGACSAGPPGDPGAVGDDGLPGPDGEAVPEAPSFGVVLPFSGPLNRTLDVELLFEELIVDPSLQLDFGEGISVESVTTTGRSSAQARIYVAPNAPIGARDVTATLGDVTAVGKGAFEVVPTIDVVVTEPEIVTQGSLLSLTIHNNSDLSFDPQSFALSSANVSPLYYGSITGTDTIAAGVVAPRATAGALAFTAKNGPDAPASGDYLSDSVGTIVERAASDVVDEVLDQSVDTPLSTRLYRHKVAPVTGFLEIEMRSEYDNPLWPLFFAYGNSGSADSFLGYVAIAGVIVGDPKIGRMAIPFHEEMQTNLYVVATDYTYGGGAGHAFDLRFNSYPAAGEQESGDHGDLPGQSLPACSGGNSIVPCVVKGAIAAFGEVDVFRVDGLDPSTPIVLMLKGEGLYQAWVQPGDATTLDVAASAFWDDQLLPVALDTRDKRLVSGATWIGASAWTIVVHRTDGGTGPYTLGVTSY